jgi:hypothetical protein
MRRFGIFIVAVGICFNVFGQKEIKIITWNVLEDLETRQVMAKEGVKVASNGLESGMPM